MPQSQYVKHLSTHFILKTFIIIVLSTNNNNYKQQIINTHTFYSIEYFSITSVFKRIFFQSRSYTYSLKEYFSKIQIVNKTPI